MKRFYCTICKKTKRVRQYPANVVNSTSYAATERIGTCNFHNPNYTSRLRNTARKVGA